MSVRSLAYQGLVSVGSPHCISINEIEAVQKTAPAARWICAEWNPQAFSWNESYDIS